MRPPAPGVALAAAAIVTSARRLEDDPVTPTQESALHSLGFRFGINGPHAARTMMLDELRVLLAHTPPDAKRADFAAAVVGGNLLNKPTRSARELTLRHLSTLYGLDAINPIFRALRRLWPLSSAAQPLLALAVALARDPLLRRTESFVLAQPEGAVVTREDFEAFLQSTFPDRFSSASLRSFAQNVAGTWTAAQLLEGRVRKTRAKPLASPEALAMLLFLGYLEGRTGQRLFGTSWTDLLCVPDEELASLTTSASNRGLLVFMNAGGVKEVRFPGYLTVEEERVRQEAAHVV